MLTDYEREALLLSLKVASVSMLWLIPIGVFFAWLLSKKQFVGKSLLDSLIHLPLVLPPVVVGYLLLVTMGRQGILGGWLYATTGLSFSFSWRGAALACIVVSLPLMVRSIRLSMEAVDYRYEQAARTLGAGGWKIFFTITLPLIIPGILSGAMISFARSLGEFGATISFVSNIPGETQTIPLAMYNFLETPGAEAQAMRLCIISILLSLASLYFSERLNHWMTQKLGVSQK
ncbi:molybdate ABC transporter permease subunit [Vibrio hippocampi]|uniref:Molybdenum transport system permease n=1 Tax=Vibrio hippocampi TaxID=654686 RepID=A0ABN8DNU9_9VIBR|nr:molybdate ABC transporter permease subunit [Vibrio hippocampi]CAH0529613.1 Molybdenum transport system permease protein ModB [Vibrio hippocampi]